MARAKKKKKSAPTVGFSPSLDSAVAKEIVAVVLAAVAILLLLAIVGVGGGLVNDAFAGLRWLSGYAAYLLPFVLFGLAFMLFQPSKYQVKANNYIGFIGFYLALAGLFHIGVDAGSSLATAKAGDGGGILGHGVDSALLSALNVPTAAVVLVAVLLICVIIAANARLSDVVSRIAGIFKRPAPKEDIKINDGAAPAAPALEIRGNIDFGGGRSKSKKPAKEPEPKVALTAIADPDWTLPPLSLLKDVTGKADAGNVKENAGIIQQTLGSFGIDVAMGEVNVGPTVTQYTLKPPTNVRLNKITSLEHNMALSLAAPAIRVEAPIPGKSAVGIEIPNKTAATVRMKQILTSPEMKKHNDPLTVVLGQDVAGNAIAIDLAKMPHVLIAGATGAGKSVMINTLLTSLLYRNSPAQLKLILVDPKRVELNLYDGIPHLLAPVIVEPEKTISALKWAVAEMERRLKLFAEVGKRNILEYNGSKQEEQMPYIVIVIDEMADLMMLAGAEVEALIVRLAQLARAAGIHLVLATQRPSVNVITGLIKANVPARIAFRVASNVDSRTILDSAGAEKLLGKGDMLFASADSPKPRRVQGVFTDESETKPITDFIREQREPQYNEEILAQPVKVGNMASGNFGDADDDMYEQAAETVIRSRSASASLLQRRLRVGYARAARLIDLLEERGVVGPADGARPREVLVASLDELGGSDDGQTYTD